VGIAQKGGETFKGKARGWDVSITKKGEAEGPGGRRHYIRSVLEKGGKISRKPAAQNAPTCPREGLQKRPFKILAKELLQEKKGSKRIQQVLILG